MTYLIILWVIVTMLLAVGVHKAIHKTLIHILLIAYNIIQLTAFFLVISFITNPFSLFISSIVLGCIAGIDIVNCINQIVKTK